MIQNDTRGRDDVWVVPDVEFSPQHLEAARSVLDDDVDWGHTPLAFASGSHAAGLGHQLSDVDLYVILDIDPLPPARSFRRDGCIVHAQPMSRGKIEFLASTAETYRATASDRSQLWIEQEDLALLVRCSIGTVVHWDAEGRGVMERFDPTTVRRVLMMRGVFPVSSLAEDVLGALETPDPYTALRASSMALDEAVAVALYATGDVYVGPKFHPRRVARSATLRPLLRDLWALQPDPPPDAPLEEVRAVAERRLLAANALTGDALLSGWDEPSDVAESIVIGHKGPRRSPYFTLLRFADRLAMAGPDAGFRTSEDVARVWLALDGRRTKEEVIAAVPGLLGNPDITPTEVDEALALLHHHEAASDPTKGDALQ